MEPFDGSLLETYLLDSVQAEDEPTEVSASSSAEVVYRLRADGRRVPVTDADAAAAIAERAGRQKTPSGAQQRRELGGLGADGSGRPHADDSPDDSATATLTPPPGSLKKIGVSRREGSATDLVEASAVASTADIGTSLSEGTQASDSATRAMMAADAQENGTGAVSFRTHNLDAVSASSDSSMRPEAPSETATEAQISASRPVPSSPVQLHAPPGKLSSASLPIANTSTASAARIPDPLLSNPRSPVPNMSQHGSNTSVRWPTKRDGSAGDQAPGERQNVRGGALRGGFPRNAQEGYGPSERFGGRLHSGQQRTHNRAVNYGGADAQRDGPARVLNVQAPQFVPRG